MAVSIGSFGENNNRFQGGFDPDSYARYWAKQNGITVIEARSQLRTKYGAPLPMGVRANEDLQKPRNYELQIQNLTKKPDKLKQQLLGIIAFLNSDTEETESGKSLTDRGLYM